MTHLSRRPRWMRSRQRHRKIYIIGFSPFRAQFYRLLTIDSNTKTHFLGSMARKIPALGHPHGLTKCDAATHSFVQIQEHKPPQKISQRETSNSVGLALVHRRRWSERFPLPRPPEQGYYKCPRKGHNACQTLKKNRSCGDLSLLRRLVSRTMALVM